MMPRAGRTIISRVFPTAPALLAAALLLVFAAGFAKTAGAADMRAALLSHDLGDPDTPANAKLALALPPSLLGAGASVSPDDFRVYIYPADLSAVDGKDERYLARGLYVWRSGNKVFLDVRAVPGQDGEGEATVRVVYAPGGVPAAETVAEGRARFTSDRVDVALAVDISLSMNYNDPKKRRVAAARTFIDMARKGGGVGRVALVTFNHHATLNTPLIPLEDGEKLLSALNRIGAEGLTNLDKPIEIALRELRGARNPVIILLTDGKNEGHVYENAHRRAAQAGVRIFSVGLSEQADHALLRAMAESTGGIYFRAVKDSDLPEIYARLAAELGKRHLLHAEPLATPRGEITIPIDGTVKRLVAVADGGARVGVNGPGGMASDQAMTSVHMGSPERGDWDFAWDSAVPGSSTLGLFGDTQMFLDVFPPQLRHEHLAVGATLAHGDKAVTGGEVWVEPVPGLFGERLRLYDDGRHGDGLPDDGVYGATVNLPKAPDRFDMTFRARSRSWDEGGFVRQTAGLALQTGEEPPGRASLGGDVDFGVLFPGETGSAVARVELDAKRPRELTMDLDWHNGASDWPAMSSNVTVEPGSRSFELEMTVPADSRPGDYLGRFRIGDGNELGDSSTARVRVGDVRFGQTGTVDLGVVPPGTFVSRALRFDYHADKAAPLTVAVEGGDGDLVVSGAPANVVAGSGGIDVEAVVSAPMGKIEGEYTGAVILRAGPGYARIPVRWEVRPYAAKAATIVPVPGLPKPPELPPEITPLRQTPELSGNLWQPDMPEHAVDSLESPWEKTEKIFRETPRLPGATATPVRTFPTITAPKTGGSGFWSAWWLYILAALLLLLLLLLLLAYILYRLGKSTLARLLLASALANTVLLFVFILLLSTASGLAAPRPQTIAVNLVSGDEPEVFQLTPAEQEMIGAASSDASSAGGGKAAVGEVSFADARAASGGGELVNEKSARLPEADRHEVELADAKQPSTMPLEKAGSASMRRRERQREQRHDEQPERELAEMAEPAPESARQRGENSSEVEEARLDIDSAEEMERPVWSEGDRPVQPVTSEQGALLADVSGMEKVSLDTRVRRVDPRGRRRSVTEAPVSEPEHRVEIDDPVRDAMQVSAPEASQVRQGDPGVREVRVEARAMGTDSMGEKPGVILPAGVSHLGETSPSIMPRGVSGSVARDDAAPRGGRASLRGASHGGSAMPDNGGTMPGGLSRADKTGKREGTGGRGTGQAVGEKRFDDTPSGASGGGLDDLLESGGGARASTDGGTPGGAPSQLSGGGDGDGDDKVAFSRPGGEGNGSPGMRGPQRRGGHGGDMPGGLDGIPGAKAGGHGDDGAGGSSSGRSRGAGAGEGRFDDMAGIGGLGQGRERLGGLGGGLSSSPLDDGFDRKGLGAFPLQTETAEWQRNERRRPRRPVSMAASSVDMDSLLIVVGDFARVPDSAASNLFGELAGSLGKGLTVEERALSPGDANLADCLLAVLSPEEVRDWSDAAVKNVADYLKSGGHIWMDAARPAQAKPFMDRLARASGGDFSSLDPEHQLSENEVVDALTLGDKLAAVVTYQDWRSDWRHRVGGDRAMRFLKRTLNYFLSGNAETGISLEPGALRGDVLVEPRRERIPDLLAGGAGEPGRLWDEFGPDTAASWRMPSWSDRGRIAAISDGEGGRALKMDLSGAVKGRAAAYRTLTPPQDFSGVDHVTLDAYYDGDGDASLSMVFTVEGPNGWSDYESRTLPLLKGWNRLRFNLGDRTFRSLSDDEENVPFPNAVRTGRAGFFLYRDSDSPAVSLFRDIRLHDR